jgi:hypothetical protein
VLGRILAGAREICLIKKLHNLNSPYNIMNTLLGLAEFTFWGAGV